MTKTSASGYDLTPLRGEARERAAADAGLDDEERRILLDHGTERPGCGLLLGNKENGLYACHLCGLPLFQSGSKFESGTGWPSFFQPVDPEHVREIRDTSHFMVRTETRCARCDGHLGHVFPDGPPPTGQRYCMNSAALEFSPRARSPSSAPPAPSPVPFSLGPHRDGRPKVALAGRARPTIRTSSFSPAVSIRKPSQVATSCP